MHFLVIVNVEHKSDVEDILAPFDGSGDSPEYTEFINVETPETKKEYLQGTCEAIEWPDGRLTNIYDSKFRNSRFRLEKDKTITELIGEKTRVPTTALKYISNCPINKVYPSYDTYLEKFYGYSYCEEEEAYGYYSNPNGKWDWYVVGGRWPFTFLVKKSCKDVIDVPSRDGNKREVPEGYKWVAGARKKDICFDVMHQLEIEKATERFRQAKEWFEADIKPDKLSPYSKKTEDAVVEPGGIAYKKGEELEDVLERYGLQETQPYALNVYAFIKDGNWHEEDCSEDMNSVFNWKEKVSAYFASVKNEDYLISIDCHF